MGISMARRALALLSAAACVVVAAAVAAPTAFANNRPAITITSPAAGATSTTNTVTVAFSENRQPKQIRALTCAVSGPVPSASAPCQTPVASATGSSSGASYSGLTDGNYALTITLTLTDGGGTTVTRDFTVAIPQPPVYEVSIEALANGTDASGNTIHPNVLIVPAFTDPSGYPLTVTVSSQPANGTVTTNGDGSFTYTPTAAAQNAVAYSDFATAAAGVGASVTIPSPAPATSDSFTLTADDGHGGTVSHVVTVPISPYYNMTITPNQVTVQYLGSYQAPGSPAPFSSQLVATPTQVSITTAQYLNLNTSFQFSTDPSDYTSALGPLTIGSCATDPTNESVNCSTPPPPSSPTSTQQIPPLPIENFFGAQTAQTWLNDTITTAVATLADGTTIGTALIIAKIAADAAEAAAAVLEW